jgi:hypothetical protein
VQSRNVVRTTQPPQLEIIPWTNKSIHSIWL